MAYCLLSTPASKPLLLHIFVSKYRKLLHTTQQVYSEYELGVRLMSIDKLSILAEFYETSVDYLISSADKKEPYPKSILNKK